MAQVIGSLRDDKATHGERIVLRKLKDNLPNEYFVYVECPLPDKRGHRYPDFIVVTNYGVIILEVKDWIQIQWADRYKAEIRTRSNKSRQVGNPVNQARDTAIHLSDVLKENKAKFREQKKSTIPWGYAVVLPNLGPATISQLRHAWGDEFVLHLDDLDAALIKSRLRVTLPASKVRDLKKAELDYIRATINPTVLIEPENKQPIILDDKQEKIVAEPIKTEIVEPEPAEPDAEQELMFAEPRVEEDVPAEEQLEIRERISSNTAIRLVRGIVGSGKTLVLTQRARYLAAQYPEWKICVMTFNKPLQTHLEASLVGIPQIKVTTFHGLCRRYLSGYRRWDIADTDDWLRENRGGFEIIQELGVAYLEDELQWMKDTGIRDRDIYLTTQRKGRGRQLVQKKRHQVFDVFDAYQEWLILSEKIDWAEVPHLVIKGIEEGEITPDQFDAILIDEAQDFAPIWIDVVNCLIKPETGILFLTDDPTQSIYRFHSWREKGVDVVGRTRWLRVPYRNTYEIYQAAYQLIATDQNLQRTLREEGIIIEPDLSSGMMRHGPKPLIQRYQSYDEEIAAVRERINHLLLEETDERQIAVLHRHNSGVKRIKQALKGLDVHVSTFHRLKGLEFKAVFLCQLQNTSIRNASEDTRSAERRLIYMAMTRARSHLYMSYQGRLPNKFNTLREYVDFIT